MGRLFILPDKEEVPGSNPGAPTSHLQGFLARTPPLEPPSATPSAIILQPKCVRLDGKGWYSLGLAVTTRPPVDRPRRATRLRSAIVRHKPLLRTSVRFWP